MSIVAWNVRGLDNPNTTRALKNTVIKFSPCIVFISENKKKQKYLKKKIDNCFGQNFHQNRIDQTNKWCVIRDANIVADQSEKEGGAPVNNNQAKWFLDFMDISGLIELPIKGGTFTWSNMRSNDQAIAEKLDKVLISKEWSLKYPKTIGMIEAAVASDHNPIIVFLEGLKKRSKDFKFESRWLLEEDCHKHVRGAWSEKFTDTENSLEKENEENKSYSEKEGKFSDGLNILSFLCWNIWKSKNALVFEMESEHPIDVWNRASAALEEFTSISSSDSMQSNFSSSSHPFPTEGAWSAPPLGFLKVNCDAAFDPHSGRATAAYVIRAMSLEME
ncbi:hypothetical protein GQ457_16G028210 [Hibiscus cannabinus]